MCGPGYSVNQMSFGTNLLPPLELDTPTPRDYARSYNTLETPHFTTSFLTTPSPTGWSSAEPIAREGTL